MKKSVIKVTTKSGKVVKVFTTITIAPTGIAVFNYYVPKKYELSYIVGNNIYTNEYIPSVIEGGSYELIRRGKFCSTAKVTTVHSVGRNIKNKQGEVIKYVPNIANMVIIEAMPYWIMGGDIDDTTFEYLPEVAVKLFYIFCKIY